MRAMNVNPNIVVRPTVPDKYALYKRMDLCKMSERRLQRYLDYLGIHVDSDMRKGDKVNIILALVKTTVPTVEDEVRTKLANMNLRTTGTLKQMRERLIKALRRQINQTAV